MRKKILCFLLFTFATMHSLNAQWAVTYGGSDHDTACSVQQTSDGGYVVAGNSSSFGAGNEDCWILKLDVTGDIEWQHTYGGAGFEYFDSINHIQQTSDGGYIAAGSAGDDVGVLKLNSYGIIEWQRFYGYTEPPGYVPSSERAYFIQQTNDGGYIVAGDTYGYFVGSRLILKLSQNGDREWGRSYGSYCNHPAYSIQQTSDGGYIVAGYRRIDKWSSLEFNVTKISSDGYVEWDKIFGLGCANSVRQTIDGGFIVAGSGEGGLLVLKLDPEGDIEWQWTYGGSGACAIQQTSDGGFIVAGDTDSFGMGRSDFWILKLDVSGDIEWQRTYGGTDFDHAFSIQQTSDGGYIVAGYTKSFGAGERDFLVLKLKSNGDIDSSCGIIGSSTATVSYPDITPQDTGATAGGLGCPPQDIHSIPQDTDAIITLLCQGVSQYALAISATNGGTTGPDPGIYYYDEIAEVTVSAIPDIHYEFSHWSGDVSGTTNPITINVDSNKSITAHFVLTVPKISVSRSTLNFGATEAGYKTADQQFHISNTGTGTLDWSLTDNATWLSFSPSSGTGSAVITVSVNPFGLSAGTYTAVITISSPYASNSPQIVNVNFNVFAEDQDRKPFGHFDTPTDNSTVMGSIAVTGWALDDIGVTRVAIKREPVAGDPAGAIGSDGLVYIGDGVFVGGARPDVERKYPNYPLSDRAGWGYMMLTYGLPNKGNGTFTLHAFAYDSSGHKVSLGKKPIISDNNSNTKPFGAIDTPIPGGIASGSDYVNWGWALTPPPKEIPRDGSTLWVFIDGVPVGHPVYNNPRQLIADRFPGYLNNDGPVGYYNIDTTLYENGTHTIVWSATDDAGETDGIGSRFFEIQNVGGMLGLQLAMRSKKYQEDYSGTLRIEVDGEREIEIEELERIELRLRGEGGSGFLGWGEDRSKRLPIGSTLDRGKGVFYWIPGPGFLGKHVLHFAVSDGMFMSKPIKITVNIVPRKYLIKERIRRRDSLRK